MIAALAQNDAERTRHEGIEYWSGRVKSFDRVLRAEVERPLNVRALSSLVEAMWAVIYFVLLHFTLSDYSFY